MATRRMSMRNAAWKAASKVKAKALSGSKKRHAFEDISNAQGEETKRRREKQPRTRGRSRKEKEESEAVVAAVDKVVAKPRPRRRSTRILNNHLVFRKPSNKINAPDYQHSRSADDIDAAFADDPQFVVEYVEELYESFLEKEAASSARPYMHLQPHLTERMRSILVDWLIELHSKYMFSPNTLYLTVNIVDRFLERETIHTNHLQLAGIAAFLIATKYEEIYSISVDRLVYLCDGQYNKRDVLDMEFRILTTLHYKVTVQTAHTFLIRYLRAANADKVMVNLSCMILDGTLLRSNLLHYRPSQLAAAAVFIARRAASRNSWSPTLLKYARYSEEEVLPIASAILKEREGFYHVALRKKYSSSRFLRVAAIRIPSSLA